MKRKTFIIDTNVILFDSHSVYKFGKNDIVLPITVIEELDRFKKNMDENGRNARHFSRLVDDLRRKGNLLEGVALSSGGTLYVDMIEENGTLPRHFETNKADNVILAVALKHKKMDKRKDVIFITKDTNLRIKADILGIKAADYELNHKRVEELYAGSRYVDCNRAEFDKLFIEKKLELNGLINANGLSANEYVILRDIADKSHTALGRYDIQKNAIVPLLRGVSEGIWGIQPRNVEQVFALDMLLNDDFKLVSLVGKAGTGKTLLALAGGLSRTIDAGAFTKVLVSRPVFPLGKDIGYLPGDIEEKLNPWMSPIFDNLEYILGIGETSTPATGGETKKKQGSRKWNELVNQGMLNIEPLTYIRGRSIASQYLIVDEAQNLSPHEIKTIITRAGSNTKIVLTGDCFQIDNPYIDSTNNGLAYVVERFKGEKIASHITLVKGERSELAELAANLL